MENHIRDFNMKIATILRSLYETVVHNEKDITNLLDHQIISKLGELSHAQELENPRFKEDLQTVYESCKKILKFKK